MKRFFFGKKILFFNFRLFGKSDFLTIFQIFFLRIALDWRALVKLLIPNIEKQRGFFLLKIFFKEKSDYWRIFEIFGFFDNL